MKNHRFLPKSLEILVKHFCVAPTRLSQDYAQELAQFGEARLERTAVLDRQIGSETAPRIGTTELAALSSTILF